MSRLIRSIGVWLIMAAGVKPVRPRPECGTQAGAHPPFAKAGTPRQTERIRFFDVKHIKAKLVVDTENHQVSGVVTHTISPLHPFLSRSRAGLRARAEGHQGERGDQCGAVHVRRQASGSSRSSSTGLTARLTRSTWPSSIRARRRAGFILSSRRPAIPRRCCRSGPRASQRIRGAGSHATTTRTNVPRAR